MSIESFEDYVKNQRRERAFTQEEESYVKKIRRIIKNRASAMKSRNKKNQHVQDLERYVLYLQALLASNGIPFQKFAPSESSDEEQMRPLTSSPTSSALAHNKRKGQLLLAGVVFFAFMFFFLKGTFASLLGIGSFILGGGPSGVSWREGLQYPGGGVIGSSAQFQAQMPSVIQTQSHNSMHSVVENLRQILSIGNQSIPSISYPNESQNGYVIGDATGEKMANEKNPREDFYSIGGEEKEEKVAEEEGVVEEEEEGKPASLLAKNDANVSNENSPVVPQNREGDGGYAGCNAAFPGIEPRTYEAREWSSKESVPYLFCNDVKHYKPVKRLVKVDGEENEVCEVQGNKTIGIIIPSSTISGPASDGNDDLIELVCTIDEINFIRRNSSINPHSNSQSPAVTKTNLPKIIP